MSRTINLRSFKALFFCTLSVFLFISCTKKVEYVNHLQHTTLKLAPAVSVKISAISENKNLITLRPVIDTQSKLENIQVKWLLEVEGTQGQQAGHSVIFEQDFSRDHFDESKLQDVNVEVLDPSLNHKVVLIVQGKSNNQDFNLTAIYNSLFQKEIDAAKDKLVERSSRRPIQGKRGYQD